jgi:hypothetical protein
LGRDLSKCGIYGREGIEKPRDRQTIGFSTIRGGGDMLAPLSGYGTSVQAEKVHIAFEKIKSSDDY